MFFHSYLRSLRGVLRDSLASDKTVPSIHNLRSFPWKEGSARSRLAFIRSSTKEWTHVMFFFPIDLSSDLSEIRRGVKDKMVIGLLLCSSTPVLTSWGFVGWQRG
jgi:hypothetical protein